MPCIDCIEGKSASSFTLIVTYFLPIYYLTRNKNVVHNCVRLSVGTQFHLCLSFCLSFLSLAVTENCINYTKLSCYNDRYFIMCT